MSDAGDGAILAVGQASQAAEPDPEQPSQDQEQVVEEDQVAECEKSLKDHAALCAATDRALRDILAADKYLADIPFDISHEEVEDQIAVLKGRSIIVHVKREAFHTLRVIVPQSTATVLDLKKAIRRTFELDQKRRRSRRQLLKSSKDRMQRVAYELGSNISWKYIWRTYHLALDDPGEQLKPLLDDQQLLSSYGVGNKSILRFVKRVKILRQQKSFR